MGLAPRGTATSVSGEHMSEDDNAFRSIGRFFVAFSKAEYEVGKAVQVVLGIQDAACAKAAVAALNDITRKINLIQSALQHARRPDNSKPNKKWISDAKSSLKKLLGINTDTRVKLAHGHLTVSDGKILVETAKADDELKITQTPLTPSELDNISQKLLALADEVREVASELSTLRIEVKIDIPAVSVETFVDVQRKPYQSKLPNEPAAE